MNMGILVECPACKIRSGLKRRICKCGNKVQKANSKNYWIDYYINGKRTRERIGRSKQAAENRLREVQTAKAEGRNIKKNKNAITTLGALRDWYLDLPEVKQKRSFKSISKCISIVLDHLGEKKFASQISPADIQGFQKKRLLENTLWGRPAKPATINRNVANFKAMFNRALDYGIIEINPIIRVKQLEENNVRERVLSREEFEVLYYHCSEQIKGPVLICYYLPMRQAEILNLTWEEIDLKNQFIRLGGQRTKNKTGRAIPFNQRIFNYLISLPRPDQDGYVFEQRWWNRREFVKAVNMAGLGNFTFHDLRHCALNNLRLAGNDRYVIKQASGHKTDSAFQRYILVTEDEMSGMKWLEALSVL
jgi:integrase